MVTTCVNDILVIVNKSVHYTSY